jgi:hypothetical protein
VFTLLSSTSVANFFARGCREGTVHSITTSAHISRAEAALCLLAELALHYEEAFHEHLPVVLLICVIKADASVALVYEHAQQVCMHSVSHCDMFTPAPILIHGIASSILQFPASRQLL